MNELPVLKFQANVFLIINVYIRFHNSINRCFVDVLEYLSYPSLVF